jgi:VanZ family protein
MWSFCFRIAGWLAVAAIVVLSLLPGQDRPHSGAPGEVEHLVAYLLAAVVLGIGYPERKTQRKLAAFLVLLSAAMEICQLWIPGRQSELAGFLGSSCGAILGMMAAMVFPNRLRPRNSGQ